MQGHIRRQIQQQTLLSLQSQQYQQGTFCVSGELHANHGLINYKDTKAKCRLLKNWVCGRYLSVWGPLPSYDPITPLHTVYVFTVYLFTQRRGWGPRGGESWTREKVSGATVHKAGPKIPIPNDWLYHQSMNSDKHLPQSYLTAQFF